MSLRIPLVHPPFFIGHSSEKGDKTLKALCLYGTLDVVKDEVRSSLVKSASDSFKPSRVLPARLNAYKVDSDSSSNPAVINDEFEKMATETKKIWLAENLRYIMTFQF